MDVVFPGTEFADGDELPFRTSTIYFSPPKEKAELLKTEPSLQSPLPNIPMNSFMIQMAFYLIILLLSHFFL